MAVSAGGERRKLGCIGQEVRYGLEASDISQCALSTFSITCTPFLFTGTDHHKYTV